MRGFYRAGFAALGFSIYCFSVTGEDALGSRLASLYELEERFEGFLDRIEEGIEPCHSSACQLEKYYLMERVHHLLSRLPHSSSPFVKDFDRGIFSGYRMADTPPPYFQAESSHIDRLRYEASQHIQWRGSWFAFLSDLYSIRNLIRYFQELSQDPVRVNRLQDLLDDGLLQLAYHLSEGRRWTDEISAARRRFSVADERHAQAQAERHFETYHSYRQRIFGNDDQQLFEGPSSVFPGLTAAQSLQLLMHLRLWQGDRSTNSIFSSRTQNFLRRVQTEIVKALEKSQNFNELEFGAVGLNRFESSLANLQLRNQQDLDLNSRQQRRESMERGVFRSADFILQWMFIHAWLGPSTVRTAAGWGGFEFWKIRTFGIDLPQSSRRAQLYFENRDFEEMMAQRFETLLKAQEVTSDRLQSVRDEIARLKKLQAQATKGGTNVKDNRMDTGS